MTDIYGYAPTEKMLDPTALAEMLRISERHLTDVRNEDPTFPGPKMLGTLPRWSPAVIRRWMDPAGTTCCSRCTGAGQAQAQAATAPVSVTRKGTKKAKGAQRVH